MSDNVTKPATKTSAVLAVYHDGVASPTAIANEVKLRYGIDVSVGAVGNILSTRGLCKVNTGRRKRKSLRDAKTKVVQMSKSNVIKNPSVDRDVSAEAIKHAVALNRVCNGNIKLALELLTVVNYVGQQMK